MFEFVKNALFGNWRTTLGAILALVGAVAIAISQSVEQAGSFQWEVVMVAVGAAVTGFFGGDATKKLK